MGWLSPSWPSWFNKEQPDAYFEETVVHLFKTCSYRVKELGPLSLKSWLTEILTRHEMSLEGTYSWISGLGKKPHWLGFAAFACFT